MRQLQIQAHILFIFFLSTLIMSCFPTTSINKSSKQSPAQATQREKIEVEKIAKEPIKKVTKNESEKVSKKLEPKPIISQVTVPSIPQSVPKKIERKKVVVSRSSQTLGQRAKNKANVRYKKLSSPSPRKWWKLLCQTIDEVYSVEVANQKTPN